MFIYEIIRVGIKEPEEHFIRLQYEKDDEWVNISETTHYSIWERKIIDKSLDINWIKEGE